MVRRRIAPVNARHRHHFLCEDSRDGRGPRLGVGPHAGRTAGRPNRRRRARRRRLGSVAAADDAAVDWILVSPATVDDESWRADAVVDQRWASNLRPGHGWRWRSSSTACADGGGISSARCALMARTTGQRCGGLVDVFTRWPCRFRVLVRGTAAMWRRIRSAAVDAVRTWQVTLGPAPRSWAGRLASLLVGEFQGTRSGRIRPIDGGAGTAGMSR